MRPLRYSINVTLDGCCDHRAGSTDEELHRYWAETLAQADALLFGRVTVVSSTLNRVDWNAELVRGDWERPFSSSNRRRGRGCSWEVSRCRSRWRS
jgi:hypothetical protein